MGPKATVFDLEERMFTFASHVRDFTKTIPSSIQNKIYIQQLLRSSSSVGANYIEANDALGDKDFLSKIKTSRREAKETRYWLRLLDCGSLPESEQRKNVLVDEAEQLIRILSAIARNVQGKH